ncbi:MAG: SiaB family protein kinase [Bacteroidales bacterium]|nr:SiaB family protein kinase [Bacteroidales bacterium]
MEIDRVFMQSVLSLYDELATNGIYIVYIGKFTQRITSMFSAMLEEELEKHSEDKKTRKRVYHAMVETMQNIQRHAEEYSEEVFSNGLFMIGKRDKIFYIITSNKISVSSKEKVVLAIDKVNNCTREELNEMYKKQLKDGKIGEHGGAGLGLIDIARKTENKIEYLFLPINFTEEYFVLKAEVDPNKFHLSEDKLR